MVVWYAFANLPLRTILRCDILFYTQGVQHGFALRMVSERPEFRLVTSAQGQAEGALTAVAFLRTQNVSFFAVACLEKKRVWWCSPTERDIDVEIKLDTTE